MKFSLAAMASAILFVPSLAKEAGTLFKDDKAYWNRLLQSYPVPTMSTPPPSPRPTTLPPTPEPPTDSPTPPPPPCDVEVSLSCTLKDDPTQSCDVVEAPTSLTCSGCPPTTLCFIYTAEPCPDPVSGALKVCMDDPPGPQAMVDLIISDGTNEFFNGMVNIGMEFCIDNGGADLPPELFTFLNLPMGGDTPTLVQMATIDSSCGEGPGGLTLLENYGAVQLTHYINCNGDNDCFVPLVYSYTAKNSGEVGATMTEFTSTLNGVPTDLIATATDDEKRLEPQEMYMNTTEFVADCCSDASYATTVTLVAVGDDGVICRDDGDDSLTKPTETPPPFVVTPEPTTPAPVTPEPTTPAPVTPEPTTPAPVTPEPTTPAPVTPEPTTPAPVTPAPTTPAPVTPEPTTPAPVTPEPTTPAPVTPEPTTPAPVTPEPTTPAPVTPAPTPPPPPCELEVDVVCVDSMGGDCNIQCNQTLTECLGKPTQIGFQYISGPCGQSDNNQSTQIFKCEDYNGGPISFEDEVFIRIVDIRGLGILYFEGSVFPGAFVPITAPAGEILQANVNATIYNSPAALPENILQTLVIHTSCSQPTFLNDCYGSLQLISFNDTTQGNVTCIEDAELIYTVTNPLDAGDATVESMLSITNLVGPGIIDGTLDLTSQVAGTTIGAGSSITFGFDVSIDTNAFRVYTVFTTLDGVGEDTCRDTSSYNFTAGDEFGTSRTHTPSAAPSV